MANRRSVEIPCILLAVLMSLSVTGISACSLILKPGHETVERIVRSENSKPETQSAKTVVETTFPSVTYETSETIPVAVDPNMAQSAFVYSVWYDVIEDNPTDESSISVDDAVALKGVFYFDTSLTAVFEAKLYKDGEIYMTRDVVLNENVVAEADFSASTEGLGTFEPGIYYIELLLDGESIAVTEKFEVY